MVIDSEENDFFSAGPLLSTDSNERTTAIVSPQSPATPRIRNSSHPLSPTRRWSMTRIEEEVESDPTENSFLPNDDSDESSSLVEETIHDDSSRNYQQSSTSLYEEETVEDDFHNIHEVVESDADVDIFNDPSDDEQVQDYLNKDQMRDEQDVDSTSVQISYDDAEADDDGRNKTDRMTFVEEVVDERLNTKAFNKESYSSVNQCTPDAELSSPESFGTPEQGNSATGQWNTPVLHTCEPVILDFTGSELKAESNPFIQQQSKYEPAPTLQPTPTIVTGPMEKNRTVIPTNEPPLCVQDKIFIQSWPFPVESEYYSTPMYSKSEKGTLPSHLHNSSRAADPPAQGTSPSPWPEVTSHGRTDDSAESTNVSKVNTQKTFTISDCYFDPVQEIPAASIADRDYYFQQVDELPPLGYAFRASRPNVLRGNHQLNDEITDSKPLYFQDARDAEDQIAYDELNGYNFKFEEYHSGPENEEEVIVQMSDGRDPEEAFMEAYSDEKSIKNDTEIEKFIDDDMPNLTERKRCFWIIYLLLMLLLAVGVVLLILFYEKDSEVPLPTPLRYELLSGPFTSDPSSGFGTSVAIDGDILAAGLPTRGSGMMHSYMLDKSESLAPQIVAGEEDNSRFGWSVDVAGTAAIVGVPFLLIADTPTPGGGASVYSYNSTAWIQVGVALRGDEDVFSANEEFGSSVSVAVTENAYRVVIGAPLSNLNDFEIGRVYTFENSLRSTGPWITMETDPLLGERSGDRFGSAVAISKDGTTFIAGSPGSDLHSDPGTAFVYKYNGFDWELAFAIGGFESDEGLGTSVAMLSNDGDTFAIGAPNYRNESGRVLVFRKSMNGLYTQVGDEIVGESGDKIGAMNLLGGTVSATGIQVLVATSQGKVRRYDYVEKFGNWSTVFEELDPGFARAASISVSGSGASSLVVGTTDGKVTVYGPTLGYEGQILPLTPSQLLSGRRLSAPW
ncbi:hypothetical protein FisN_24Lh133 [Fistulifera solaris]|uniref:Uncharacterized protein n=1 Tax=Fistulifera solaris TaxID=1519565 RepID=A0A1Z5K993_FISSO|nr:hypothetical protein FisN_24Lh133 [Fistulifera solaris]|eukprot:GAX22849.1 hypothetical protein FisN_24Lh133 [Fistulifera solaris]